MKIKVAVVIAALLLVVAVFAYMNREGLEEKTAAQTDAIIFFKAGEVITEVNFDLLDQLPAAEFPAALRSSGRPPVDVTFTGVQLKDILEQINFVTQGKTQILTRAVDGYTVVLSVNEVLEDDNVYVVFKQDGELLGAREEGGTGPYRLVIRDDEFAQRWNKYLMEIELR